ncbi:MAG: monooxygenase, partial [Burkholderiales bacterium]|nr:monooxygenase [Anaerolineae bacterium]
MTKNIGIIGSGFAGLHLGLMLQKAGIDVTLYTDRTAEQMRGGAPALLARWAHTIERERELGINLWDDAGSEFYRFNFYINTPQPLIFTGEMDWAASFIDPRLYLSTLQEVFIGRGGRVSVATVSAGDIITLSEDHDLMVVASGRGSMIDMFPRLPERSFFNTPARYLNIAYFTGFESPDEDGVQFVLSPGHGEIIMGTVHSFNGPVQGMLFEGVPGGDFDRLSAT